MATINNIKSEFDAMVPAIAEQYKSAVRFQFERLVEKHGAGNRLARLSGEWGQDGGIWRGLVRRNTRTADPRRFQSDQNPAEINAELLERNAKRYGEEQVAAFTAKLIRKLGDLSDVSIDHLDHAGGEFTVRGKLGDRDVIVQQQRVFKISSKGTPFNQWPARIYVDGEFTPESKFKKL